MTVFKITQQLIMMILLPLLSNILLASCPPTPQQETPSQCPNGDLIGSWQLIPNVLIPPDQIDRSPAKRFTVSVPGYWDTDALGLEQAQGLATLWLDINVDASNANHTLYSFWPGRFQPASRIYIDDGMGQTRKVFDNLSEFLPEQEITSSALPGRHVSGLEHFGGSSANLKLGRSSRVIIHLYNEDYRTGGAAQAPVLGPTEVMYRKQFARSAAHMILLGACLLITVYCLSLAYFSESRRAFHIFLILMAFGSGLRLLITGNLLQQIMPSIRVDHQAYISWFSFLILLTIFIACQVFVLARIFDHFKKLRLIFLSLPVTPLILMAIAPWVELKTFLQISHVFRAAIVSLSLVYSVFLFFQLRRHSIHLLELSSMIMIIVAGASDIYLYQQNKDPYVELFSLAIFLFIVIQAGRLGWGYIHLLAREKNLSMDLKDLNESLEVQVSHRTQELESANARLSLAAATDALTNLPNRRSFDREIIREIRRADRNNSKLCLAIADVDWFKKVNDNYGHHFGDQVLESLAKGLRERLRVTDYVARIGGEEFAILLPNSDSEVAFKVLEELRLNIAQLKFPEVPEFSISLSIGCCQWQAKHSDEDLYKCADLALYQAKAQGRGRVSIKTGQAELANNKEKEQEN